MEHRIVDIIDGTDECCIMLYGDIGDWGSIQPEDIVKKLMTAESEGRRIDVRINSVGGEVYAALAIFNALRASRADITIYIDCLAASAASVIAGCGRRVKIASNGRLMIHSVRGYAEGTVEEIRNHVAEMEQLEAILCDIYAQRTGQSTEQIRNSYFDGKDHWLTASEALRLGFVDEVFDTEAPDDMAPSGVTPRQICDAYTQRYINSLETQTSKDKTMFNKLKARPRFIDCADEAAAIEKVAELENQAATAETLRAERDALKEERDRLKAENEEFIRREQEAEDAEIRNMADEYVQDGRIPADQKDNALAMLRANKATARAYFDSLKPKRRIIDRLDKGDGVQSDPLEERKEEVRKRLGR
jgi:ATP-dependent Clp endopeptidase proteolytic subunit ClpP